MDNTKKTEQSHKLFALNIVKSFGKKIFAKDKAMSCLAKSDSFFTELLNICNGLFYFKISPQNFCDTINSLDIDKTDSERLKLVSTVYSNYIETMQKNSYSIPFYNKLQPFCGNYPDINIKKRAEFLNDCFFQKDKTTDFEKCENIKYLEFSDIQNEAQYITETIKTFVQNGTPYSKIALFADKTATREKFSTILKSYNIPVFGVIYNENYENLKHKINMFEQIAQICKRLNLTDFTYQDFKDSTSDSKAQKEISVQELDTTLASLLSEVLDNSYTLDRIINLKENSQKPLLEAIHLSWHKIDETDTKILNTELNAIRIFYESYRQNNFAKAIESVIKRYISEFEAVGLKDIVASKIKSLNELQNLYDNILNSPADFNVFKDIMQSLPKEEDKEQNGVYLSSIHVDMNLKKSFDYVFIAGLSENNFPGSNPSYPFVSENTNSLITKELKTISKDYDSFMYDDQTYISQRFLAFLNIFTKVSNQVFLTTHTYESKKSVQPSFVFKLLAQADKENFEKIQNDEIKQTSAVKTTGTEPESKTDSVVIDENDILKLNTSAISTFLQCKRKYYYKNLLNLKEKYDFSASYGSVVHAVFELMNRKFLTQYSKETALGLAAILFDSKTNSQKVLETGFKQIDTDLITESDDLSVAQMKKQFEEAIEDYFLCGYFNKIPTQAVCEKSFRFKVEELPNVEFDGRIDAILSYSGDNVIVDYKTGHNKETLQYTISDYGVNFLSKTGKTVANLEKQQNTYDYQIPLYYLACQYCDELSEYKDNISSLGYLYVRPKSKDDGCDDDFIDAENIEKHKEKIIQNIKETVVDKIRTETEFKPNKTFNCENCSYKFLCDEVEDDD